MKKSLLILTFASIAFVSCTKDDNPTSPEKVTPPTQTATIKAATGGPNQPNQVFVDLSANVQSGVKRDSWDLGFYNGTEFRVVINGTIKMAVKQLNTSDITAVQTEDTTVTVGFDTTANLGYVDQPTGNLFGEDKGVGTAIKTISEIPANNKVYLVNLGYEVGTTTPKIGSVALEGNQRGWKKIKVNKKGNDYELQYADLNATTFQTVTISKDASYNFTYFNLKTNQKVKVQPTKKAWDISFTGFTNYFPYGQTEVTYYFADYIVSNTQGGTAVYMVEHTADKVEAEYEKFNKASVVDANFTKSATDQRVIGDSWRNGGGPDTKPSIKDTRFYIVKDAEGNIYKLRFLAMTNDAGERGNPVFEYKLLQ